MPAKGIIPKITIFSGKAFFDHRGNFTNLVGEPFGQATNRPGTTWYGDQPAQQPFEPATNGPNNQRTQSTLKQPAAQSLYGQQIKICI
jgi:hypothetical protein